MGGSSATSRLLAPAAICAAYGALLAVAPTASRSWLSVLALALAVGAGWRAGARAGGILGALLGALQLAFAPATSTPVVTHVTFALAQLVLVIAAYGTGTARQRLDDALAAARKRGSERAAD